MVGPRAERRKALQSIIDRLLNATSYDTESEHVLADGLLTEALRALSDGEWSESLVSDIIDAYDAVGKWHA